MGDDFVSNMDEERIEDLKREDREEALAERNRRRWEDDPYGLGDNWR